MTDSTTHEAAVEALANPGEQGETPELEVETAPDDTGAQEIDATAEGQEPEGDNEDDFEDFDHDGQTFKVHKALKPALLRQADYTQKTQALAQSRQAFEAEAQTRLQQLQQRETAIQGVEEAAKAVTAERVNVEIASKALKQYDEAIRAAFAQADQAEAQRLMFEREQWRIQHDDAVAAASAADKQLAEQRQKLSVETEQGRKAQIQAGWRQLEADPAVKISSDVFNGVVTAAAPHGFSADEVFNVALADPRMFKFLKVGTDALAENAKLKAELAARKGTPPASAKPVTKVGGASGGSARKTTDASGDGLSADEWARREMARTASLKSANGGKRHPLVT